MFPSTCRFTVIRVRRPISSALSDRRRRAHARPGPKANRAAHPGRGNAARFCVRFNVGRSYGRCERLAGRRYSPPCITAAPRKRVSAQPQGKEGWLRQKKFREATEADATGVVFLFCCQRDTTPASRTADASRYLLDRSAPPPRGFGRRGIYRLIPNSFTP